MLRIFTIVLISTLLASCAEPQKCSDQATLNSLRNIIIKQIGGATEVSKEELENIFQFNSTISTDYIKEIRKYNCQTRLVVGGKLNLDIRYSSQLDDDGNGFISALRFTDDETRSVANMFHKSIKFDRSLDKRPPPLSVTPENIVGKWGGERNGVVSLDITRVARSNNFDISMSVVGNMCSGELEGKGTLENNVLTIKKYDDGEKCNVFIDFSGNDAHVVTEQCAYYHGALCEYNADLRRLRN